MEIKDIIQKALKGEALTDDEKSAVKDFDFGKYIDGAQADARRKAEAGLESEKTERAKLATQIEELQKQVKAKDGEKLTVTEQLQRALSDLQSKFEASEKRTLELSQAQAKATRTAKVQALTKKYGIQFIEGVDPSILNAALESTLATVEDARLEDDTLVKPLFDSFRTANKAVIKDLSGGGAGTPPKGAGSSGLDGKPVDQMTAAERQTDLKKRGIL